jgi:transcription antitermination factor NusG
MPILPPEPDCFPADLWENPRTSASTAGTSWWCLHTKPRQEKAIARELRKANVAYYLPQAKKESRTPQGRRIESVVPLFPSYIFLNGKPEDRVVAARGNRLVAVLDIVDQEALTRDLQQIHTMINAGLVVTEEPTIPVGAMVRVVNGPLTGLTGKVIKRGNRDHFAATVRFLGRGATVLLQDWQVERLAE